MGPKLMPKEKKGADNCKIQAFQKHKGNEIVLTQFTFPSLSYFP